MSALTIIVTRSSKPTVGRPASELVVRSASAIGNYDYLVDYVFRQDGSISKFRPRSLREDCRGPDWLVALERHEVAASGPPHERPVFDAVM